MTSRTGPAGGLSAEWQHLSGKNRRVLDSVFLRVHCAGNKVSPRGAARRWQFDPNSRQTTCLSADESAVRTSDVWFAPDMELGHWVTYCRSMGHLGHLSLPGHRVIILTRCETPSFSGFRKKCPKCKTYIWNGEMTKVIVRCLLLDWNHWMSVHVMNFYLWSLKILWPEKTSSHISRHLEFIIEQGH